MNIFFTIFIEQVKKKNCSLSFCSRQQLPFSKSNIFGKLDGDPFCLVEQNLPRKAYLSVSSSSLSFPFLSVYAFQFSVIERNIERPRMKVRNI